MRIALLYPAWEGEGWSSPIGFHREMMSRGWDVRHFNTYHNDGELMPGKNVRAYSAECINNLNFAIKNHGYRPDAVMVFDYGVFDAPQLDKRFFPGIPFVLEAGDCPQAFRMHMQKAHKFDLILSPDHPSTDMFNKLGLNAKFWTHCADTEIFYPRPEIDEVFDCVTTCGSRGRTDDGSVTDVIQRELGERFNNERYFFGNQHAERLNMGKIVFQHSQFGEITRRAFEGMACGKMVLTDRLPEETLLQELFIDGEDIVYYDDAQDAIDKIKYYAENTQERQRIARNGLAKVLDHHSCHVRVNDLEQYITELSHVSEIS